jgi:phosphotransferase system  glucose/maltose/N-acetylglucosamine-specific IIC component
MELLFDLSFSYRKLFSLSLSLALSFLEHCLFLSFWPILVLLLASLKLSFLSPSTGSGLELFSDAQTNWEDEE